MSIEQTKRVKVPKDGTVWLSDDLSFNLFASSLSAKSTDKTVLLSPKESGLLLLLASRDGIVSIDSISEWVYDDDSYGGSRIGAIIGRVIEKIEELNLGFDPIMKYKKKGYSFSPKPKQETTLHNNLQ